MKAPHRVPLTVLLLSTIAMLSMLAVAADGPRRRVNVYTATNGPETLRWLRDASAEVPRSGGQDVSITVATGVYFCCVGFFTLLDNGTLQHMPVQVLRTYSAPVMGAGLETHFVMDLRAPAVLNETWRATGAVEQLAAIAVQVNVSGILVDYEPGVNYTMAHAVAYGRFLTALSNAMHRVGRQSGFCSGNWGIIDMWPAYVSTDVDFSTSMIYGWIGDGAADRDFVTGQLAAGFNGSAIGFGVGTMMRPPYERRVAPQMYNWTASVLEGFASWLTARGVVRIDLWRSDIDLRLPANATEPWMFRAVAAFLAGAGEV